MASGRSRGDESPQDQSMPVDGQDQPTSASPGPGRSATGDVVTEVPGAVVSGAVVSGTVVPGTVVAEAEEAAADEAAAEGEHAAPEAQAEIEGAAVGGPEVEVPDLARPAAGPALTHQVTADDAPWDEAWLPQWVHAGLVTNGALPPEDPDVLSGPAPEPPLPFDREDLTPGASTELSTDLRQADRTAEDDQAQLAAWAADIAAAEALAAAAAGTRISTAAEALPAVRTPPSPGRRRRYRVLLPAAVLVLAGVVAGFALPGGSDGAGPSVAAVQRDTDQRAAPTTSSRPPTVRPGGAAAPDAGDGVVDPPVVTAPTGSPSTAAAPRPRTASAQSTSPVRDRVRQVVAAPRARVQPRVPAGSAVQPPPAPPAQPAPTAPTPDGPAPTVSEPAPIDPPATDPVGEPPLPDGDCPVTVPEDSEIPDEGADESTDAPAVDVAVDVPAAACTPVDPGPQVPDPDATDPPAPGPVGTDPQTPEPEGTDPGDPQAPGGPGDGSSGGGGAVPPTAAPDPTPTPTATPTPTPTPTVTSPSPMPTASPPPGVPDPSATLAEALGRS